jgi:hypothetical protein
MQGNEIVWIASVILGLTVLGWLVMDWLESVQPGERPDVDPHGTSYVALGRAEHPLPDAMDVETALMLGYPLDPFAPAPVWRSQPLDQWVEAEEGGAGVTDDAIIVKPPPAPRPSEAA